MENSNSEKGSILVTAICCLVLWGIMAMIMTSDWDKGIIFVVIICAYFGWKALTSIQPAMFVWMPIFGWFLYIFIKFILSAAIGFIVAPFVLGKKISGAMSE